MDDVGELVEMIRAELLAWHRTPEGRSHDAPAWWQGIHERLDLIKANRDDFERLSRAILHLEYFMVELGPVSPTVAPSFVKFQGIAERSNRK